MSGLPASIIIRTFNEGKHLAWLLDSIEQQCRIEHEMIIVDSGSNDHTLEIARRYPVKIINIRSEDFSFGRSLNIGCRQAVGEYLVFISAHSYPVNGMWLFNILKPFEDLKVGMVYGRQVGNKVTKLSEERDLHLNFGDKSKILVEESFGNNANAAVRRSLWENEPFDERLPGLEDIDWAKKAQQRGYYVYYKSDAVICHVHDETYAQIYNRFKREAMAYRVIFPAFHYSAWRASLSYSLILFKDMLYGLKHLRSPKKIMSSILYRLAEFKGLNDGYRQVGSLNEGMKADLYSPKRNRSVVISQANQHEIREQEIPALRNDEVLIKVKYTGVCTTDLEVLKGELEYYKTGWAKYPIVPGHEFSGKIVKLGRNVKEFVVGDKVVGECILGCGACQSCLAQNPICCAQRKEVGVLNYDGAYSRYLKLPGRAVHKLGEHIGFEQGCLVEPLAVSLRGINRLIGEGQDKPRTVAVLGFGTIGNLCAQVMKHKGHRVTVFDKNQARIGALKDPAIKGETELTNLERFDSLIEATGQPEVLKKALVSSMTGAKILLLGLPYKSVEFDFGLLVSFDKTVIGSVGSSRSDFIEALRLIDKLELDALTRYVFNFEDYKIAWEKQRNGDVIKAILRIDEA